jgi:hypothetical protein
MTIIRPSFATPTRHSRTAARSRTASTPDSAPREAAILRFPSRARPAAEEPAPSAAGAPVVDADFVVYRLEEAGTTLLSLPGTGWSTRLRTSSLDIVRSALESYGWTEKLIRPPVPSAQRITRMDEALGWIALIPQDRYVLRRIVGARSLVSPTTERHLYPWRRLGTALGADHKAVQRWHAQGIDLIVAALNRARG